MSYSCFPLPMLTDSLSHSHTHTMKGDWVGVLEGSPRIWSLQASIKKHKIPPHVNKTLSWESRKQEAFLFLLLSCMPKAVRTCLTHILSLLSPTLQQGSLACYHVTQVCWWCKSAILWRYWSNYATLWHGRNTPWDTKLRHQNKTKQKKQHFWQRGRVVWIELTLIRKPLSPKLLLMFSWKWHFFILQRLLI